MFRKDVFEPNRITGPSTILPSDVEPLIREILQLKEEIRKIKKALAEHGIKVD